MEFMEIIDQEGNLHFINPNHISAICEFRGQCKINLMGHDYIFTKDNMEDVMLHLTSFKH